MKNNSQKEKYKRLINNGNSAHYHKITTIENQTAKNIF